MHGQDPHRAATARSLNHAFGDQENPAVERSKSHSVGTPSDEIERVHIVSKAWNIRHSQGCESVSVVRYEFPYAAIEQKIYTVRDCIGDQQDLKYYFPHGKCATHAQRFGVQHSANYPEEQASVEPGSSARRNASRAVNGTDPGSVDAHSGKVCSARLRVESI